MPKTAPKSPNSSASVLKTTSSHKRRRWKRAKHWFWRIPRKRWAKMVSEVPKMIVLWTFATKPRPKASLTVCRNLLPYIFQGGLQPGSPSRRAAPARNPIVQVKTEWSHQHAGSRRIQPEYEKYRMRNKLHSYCIFVTDRKRNLPEYFYGFFIKCCKPKRLAFFSFYLNKASECVNYVQSISQ